jgi:hypothetical protein
MMLNRYASYRSFAAEAVVRDGINAGPKAL